MKIAVIYKSKTGFTQKYAQWIAEELSADIFEASKINNVILDKYDTIIYGGGLYVGGINGVKLVTKNMDQLKSKRVIVFATGASPCREDVISDVKNKNFTEEGRKVIHFFYLRGGFDFSKLKTFDKFLMMMLKAKLKNKKEEEMTPDERGMLAAYEQSMDFTDIKKIDEIVACARG
jgi:menaquinone-dependent protoporphyrinogen IX oxidase